MVSTVSDACLLPPGDKVRRASGWASEGRAADGSGEAEEADAEEESRVRLPDPPGEDGTAAPGAPGPIMSVPVVDVCVCVCLIIELYVWNLTWLERIDPSPSKLVSKAFAWAACLHRDTFLTIFLSEHLQRIRDLEDKTEIQRRQIKDLEEKVGHVWCLTVKKWMHTLIKD